MLRRHRILSFVLLLLAWNVGCTDQLFDGHSALLLRVDRVISPTQPLDGGLAVTVLGHNFDAGTEIRLDDQAVTLLQIVDEGELSFVSPPHAAGPATLSVKNGTGQRVQLEDAVFYAASSIVINDELDLIDTDELEDFTAQAVKMADLDGDGRGDLVIAGYNRGRDYDYAVRVFINETSNRPMLLSAAFDVNNSELRGIADVNGDGFDDLVFELFVVLGHGNGSFDDCRYYYGVEGEVAEARRRAEATLIGDFDGDSATELAVMRWGTNALQIYSLTSLEPGQCGAPGEIVRELELTTEPVYGSSFSGGTHLTQPATAGDFNSDGIDDIVYVSSDRGLHSLLGPDMQEVWAVVPDDTHITTVIQVAETGGDGGLDFVGPYATSLVVYRGADDGTFAEPQVLPVCAQGLFSTSMIVESHTWSKSIHSLVTCENGSIVVVRWNHPLEASILETYHRDIQGQWPAATATWGLANGDDREDIVYLDGGTAHALYGAESEWRIFPRLSWPYPVSLGGEPTYAERKRLDALGGQRVVAGYRQYLRVLGPTPTGYDVTASVDLDLDLPLNHLVALADDSAVALYGEAGADTTTAVWLDATGEELVEAGRTTIADQPFAVVPGTGLWGLAGEVRGNGDELVVVAKNSLWIVNRDAATPVSVEGFGRDRQGHLFDLDGDGYDELFQAQDDRVVYWNLPAGGAPIVLWDNDAAADQSLHDALAYRQEDGSLALATVAMNRCAGDCDEWYGLQRRAYVTWLDDAAGQMAVTGVATAVFRGGKELGLQRADFNGDTRPDLAVVPNELGMDLAVFPALSDGLVDAPTVLPVLIREGEPYFWTFSDLLVTDVDGDRLADVLLAKTQQHFDQVSVLLNESL